MNALRLILNSLRYHVRSHIAVIAGVFVAATALSGALLVGDSLRGSLRDHALQRLGPFDAAITTTRSFRQALAKSTELAAAGRMIPALILRGSATHATSGARANQIQLIGLDRDNGATSGSGANGATSADRVVRINDALADELGAKAGDEIVLRLTKSQAANAETLMGRRDEPPVTLRVTIGDVVPSFGIGGFSLRPTQSTPKNVFVPLATLQRIAGLRERANTLLVGGGPAGVSTERLGAALRAALKPSDLGVRVRINAANRYIAVESESMLLEPPVETAALAAAKSCGLAASPILTYLANRITNASEASGTASVSRSVPYSVVAAIDPATWLGAEILGEAATSDDGIWLNDWTSAALGAGQGNAIELEYYTTAADGTLDTRRTEFRAQRGVPLAGLAADPGFVGEYPGVTDTKKISDWDPPFPMDLKRIGERDEQYWAEHRTTPKAFVTLDAGRRIWAESGERFGRVSSIWLRPLITAAPTATTGAASSQGTGASADAALTAISDRFERALLRELDPGAVGLRVEALREQAIAAADGPTDFGGLFIGFSFFVIAAAGMLVTLLFRLGVERRAGEVGTLLAMGLGERRVLWLLIGEGAALAAIGTLLGQIGAAAYAWLMLAGLRGWWSAAVNAPFLEVHVSAASVAIGSTTSFGLAMIAIFAAVRGMTKLSPRTLMAGGAIGSAARRTRSKGSAATAAIASAVAIAAIGSAAAGWMPSAGAFFLGGSATLVALLAVWRMQLRASDRQPGTASALAQSQSQDSKSPIAPPADAIGSRFTGVGQLASRNAARSPGRSLLTVALLASASFLIAALSAFQIEPIDMQRKDSGSGGFTLWAECTTPLLHDLATPAGQAALGLDDETRKLLADTAHIYSMRLRPGDAASCTNLYARQQPRVIGATDELIRRGGFAFSAVTSGPRERSDGNPWDLLNEPQAGDLIPAIGDEAAVQWQLHSGLGQDYEIVDERGQRVRLRFVALLSGSTLQDELIVSDESFRRLFPSSAGRAFFLIDVPEAQSARTAAALERALADQGFDVGTTRDRMLGYLAVQNTYLSTFQTLGGLGMVLGTLGLAAVTLRSVWERRRELALLTAIGWSEGALRRLLVIEQARLVIAGLGIGAVAALVAVAPVVFQRPATIPWQTLGGTFAAVALLGVGVCAAALRGALPRNPMAALKAE